MTKKCMTYNENTLFIDSPVLLKNFVENSSGRSMYYLREKMHNNFHNSLISITTCEGKYFRYLSSVEMNFHGAFQ